MSNTTLTGYLDSKGPWKVTLRRYASTWHYFTTNPSGGGGGSNHQGSKSVARAAAVSQVPAGASYTVETYNEERLIKTERLTKGRGED